MNPKPSLGLFIMVYRGGQYWEECWPTVAASAHLFDEILVSINFTELQASDAQVVRRAMPPNVRLILQPVLLTSVQHNIAAMEEMATDYVLYLCHDDWLLPAGVRELSELIAAKGASEAIGVFGSFAWQGNERIKDGSSDELGAFPEGIAASRFVKMDIDQSFTGSLSGLVAPVRLLKQFRPAFRFYTHGFRFDNQMVTCPGIKTIYRTDSPLVRIRLHAASEGQKPFHRLRDIDNLNYYFIQGIYRGIHSRTLARSCARTITFYLAKRPSLAMRFLRLAISSIRWPRPKHAGRFWWQLMYSVFFIFPLESVFRRRDR